MAINALSTAQPLKVHESGTLNWKELDFEGGEAEILERLKGHPENLNPNVLNDPFRQRSNAATLIEECGFHQAYQALLKHGAELPGHHLLESVLHKSARFGYCRLATLLLESGAQVLPNEHYLETPLHLAIKKGHTDFVRVLLTGPYEQFINKKNSEGETALHLAVFYGFSQIIEVLISAGADITISNNKGQTALNIAESGGISKLREKVQDLYIDGRPFSNGGCSRAGNHQRSAELLEEAELKRDGWNAMLGAADKDMAQSLTGLKEAIMRKLLSGKV